METRYGRPFGRPLLLHADDRYVALSVRSAEDDIGCNARPILSKNPTLLNKIVERFKRIPFGRNAGNRRTVRTVKYSALWILRRHA